MRIVYSFGAKYRDPWPVADRRVSALGIHNPHRHAGHRTGLDPDVRRIVLADPKAQQIIDRLLREDPDTVVIYCMGGTHRSVAIAEELGRRTGAEVVHCHRSQWHKGGQ